MSMKNKLLLVTLAILIVSMIGVVSARDNISKNVKKGKIEVDLDDIEYTHKCTKKHPFKVILVDDYGRKLSNKRIIFIINGKTYVNKTNKNGVANIYLNLKKGRIYKIKYTFKGDSRYKRESEDTIIRAGYKCWYPYDD